MSKFAINDITSATFKDSGGNEMKFYTVKDFKIKFDDDDTDEISFYGGCMEIKEAEMQGLAKKEETPPTMPTAEVAREVTKVIQEDQRNKAIMEEWGKLTKLICAAIKQGSEWITVRTLYDDNKNRLEQMGYRVVKESTTYNWRITWMEPEFQF